MYGIFTYIWLFLMVKYGFHVGKYTSPMDGKGVYPRHISPHDPFGSEAWENTQDVASVVEEMELNDLDDIPLEVCKNAWETTNFHIGHTPEISHRYPKIAIIERR